jgi:hypothetical protein
VAPAEADANPNRCRKGLAMPTVDQIGHGFTSRPITVTSTADGRDHLINEQTTATGVAHGRGTYLAICGHLVIATPLAAPPGPTCWDCETALHRTTIAGITPHRRTGLLARLLRRGVAPTHSPARTARTPRGKRG